MLIMEKELKCNNSKLKSYVKQKNKKINNREKLFFLVLNIEI